MATPIEFLETSTAMTMHPDMQALSRGASALLALLSLDAHARAHALGVERILFMTREGILFKKYYDIFFKEESNAPIAELLRVSRLSTFTASLHGGGPQDLYRLINQYPRLDWSQLLASLGESPTIGETQHDIGIKLLNSLQTDSAWSAWLNEIAALRHAELKAYLVGHHHAAFAMDKLLVVDVGWRGTIQDNLALAFPEKHWYGLYLGLFPFLNKQPPNTSKQGILFDSTNNCPKQDYNLLPVEYLFHQPVPTIAGYLRGHPQPLAMRQSMDIFSQRFQQAVLDDAKARSAQWKHKPTDETRKHWNREAMDFWYGCQHMPLSLFQALCNYSHEETFGLGQIVHLPEAISPRAALRSLISTKDRTLFVQHISTIPIEFRSKPELGIWLRSWLHLRHFLNRLQLNNP